MLFPPLCVLCASARKSHCQLQLLVNIYFTLAPFWRSNDDSSTVRKTHFREKQKFCLKREIVPASAHRIFSMI